MTIYWLRNDLRLHDNECLHRAIKNNDPVLLVYIVDPRNFRKLDQGFKKTGALRFEFLCQSLSDLRKSCRSKGGNLCIQVGHPEEILPELVEKRNATQLIYQKEITTEEVKIEKALALNLADSSCNIEEVWGLTLYHIDDAPFPPEETPLTSKAFRIPLGKEAEVRKCLETPTRLPNAPDIEEWGELPKAADFEFDEDELSSINLPYEGGESDGLKRLDHYTFQTELLTTYRWTRNRSLGKKYSSKFSPWLALGCLSPRKIYWQVKDYEKEIKKNASTWWMVFELVWRDYFKFLSIRFGSRIFYPGGHREREVDWNKDQVLFERWKEGKTGIPFVDAHMRELNETGFMSNRGRVNCASFLTRDYKIDWRWGAAWFENRLLDYDVSSNWLNWSTQAMEIWYTNPVHQGLKYDKKGEYVRTWLPELKDVEGAVVQAPWLLPNDVRSEMGAGEYPVPVNIYKKWTRSINNIEKARSDKFKIKDLAS